MKKQSKYLTRAEEIAENTIDGDILSSYSHKDSIIEAMCQLADEVEKETINILIQSKTQEYRLYSKEQIEELLRTQSITKITVDNIKKLINE